MGSSSVTVFRKIAGATTLTFVALGTMVWLSQALREFDLVTANGQTVWTFLYVSALLVPALVTIVLPVALLIAVIYAFTNLNNNSELVVVELQRRVSGDRAASGAPRRRDRHAAGRLHVALFRARVAAHLAGADHQCARRHPSPASCNPAS